MTPRFERLTASDWPRVAHLRVAPDQQRFSGTVREAFDAGEAEVDFHGIFDGEDAVGFFKIDRGYSKSYGFAAPSDLGLRAFLIDLRHQGKGIGRRACRALPAHLAPLYPCAGTLWLTVNVINLPAIRSYRSGGFEDTGEIWPKGAAGPQHIMRCALSGRLSGDMR